MPYESDEEMAVFAEVTSWESSQEVITDGCARTIAAWWHSPSVYDEPITALSHTGAILDGIYANIDRDIRENTNGSDDQARALRALRAYCDKRIADNDTDRRDGWSNVWAC